MRVLVNYVLRDGCWQVHCVAEDDARSPISDRITVEASGAGPGEIQRTATALRHWGRGSSFIDVNHEGRKLLHIWTLPRPGRS